MIGYYNFHLSLHSRTISPIKAINSSHMLWFAFLRTQLSNVGPLNNSAPVTPVRLPLAAVACVTLSPAADLIHYFVCLKVGFLLIGWKILVIPKKGWIFCCVLEKQAWHFYLESLFNFLPIIMMQYSSQKSPKRRMITKVIW